MVALVWCLATTCRTFKTLPYNALTLPILIDDMNSSISVYKPLLRLAYSTMTLLQNPLFLSSLSSFSFFGILCLLCKIYDGYLKPTSTCLPTFISILSICLFSPLAVFCQSFYLLPFCLLKYVFDYANFGDMSSFPTVTGDSFVQVLGIDFYFLVQIPYYISYEYPS
jgi:hypothetical protein